MASFRSTAPGSDFYNRDCRIFGQLFLDIGGSLCVICILIGFHARKGAMAFGSVLLFFNVKHNQFWTHSGIMNDFLRFDFFQVRYVR